VAVKGNDHVAFWKLNFARTRSGHFLQQPRREFRIMVIFHLPERVVAVTKRPRPEISGRGCFTFATTRSGFFFAHLAFSHFERNIYTMCSLNASITHSNCSTYIVFQILMLSSWYLKRPLYPVGRS
jgi:hypothetical protein